MNAYIELLKEKLIDHIKERKKDNNENGSVQEDISIEFTKNMVDFYTTIHGKDVIYEDSKNNLIDLHPVTTVLTEIENNQYGYSEKFKKIESYSEKCFQIAFLDYIDALTSLP